MIKIDKLNFGTAGIPLSTNPRDTINGINQVKILNLDSLELEFVHSINITKEKAPEVNQVAKKNDIILTVHGPYYINLNAKEKPKWHASISRIIQSAKIGYLCGAYSICFHPAYYLKDDPKDVYNKVKEALNLIMKNLRENNIDIWIRPETAGKIKQFGNIKELIDLSSEFENVLPCIDWSHIHAYNNGRYNSVEEFREILILMEKKLGKNALENVHFHCQGINYNETGERNHLNLQESDFNYKDLIKIWKEFKLKGVVTCESPNIEKDALLLKGEYYKT